MLTQEEHARLLRSFEVDRLLKLLELEAQRHYRGYYVIFRFHAGFKVVFGIPSINPPGCTNKGYAQLSEMTHYPTLKEAIIEAMVTGKTFDDYFSGDPELWQAQQTCPASARELQESRQEGYRLVLYKEDEAGRTCPAFQQDCPLPYESSCEGTGSMCGGFWGTTPTGYVKCRHPMPAKLTWLAAASTARR